ncbi:MAG: hypothetical protein IJ300_14050 [Clostridia bacterium]|nr:hypothetical protein [Clostridia bacterium]
MYNKLTDNEIIKAFECCNNESGSCVGCPLRKINRCVNQLQESALDFINRQKAEIEKLERANIQLMAILQTAQSEAIKEFAERLEKKKQLALIANYYVYVVTVEDIDKLLKEMDEKQHQ